MREPSIRQKVVLICFGFFLSFFLLEIGLRLGGFVCLSLQERRNSISLKQRGTYRIVCLGESTTAMGGEYSYPSQLEAILNQRNTGIRFSVINEGYIACRMGEVLSRLEHTLQKYNPDMVITMLGINDEMDVLRAGTDHGAGEPASPPEDVTFLNSLRTYKLARLIRQRIANRLRKRRVLKFGEKFAEAKEDDSKSLSDFAKQEVALEGDLDSGAYGSFVRLGHKYKNRAEYGKAEEMFKKALEVNPRKPEAYIEYSRLYLKLGEYDKRKMMLEKALALNSESDEILSELGSLYLFDDNWEKAGSFLERALKINPKNVNALVMLALSYEELGKVNEAEKMFRRAIDMEPGNILANSRLGGLYTARGEYGKAEKLLQRALEANPRSCMEYVELGVLYINRKEYAKAEALFSKAIGIHPRIRILHGMLSRVRREKGEEGSPKESLGNTRTSGLEGYRPVVRYHYRRLKEIVTGRGIKLVCVQYPLCSVEPLKRMLGENARMYFVDNEQVFINALKKADYREYFTDDFAGEFGHCTPKGNRLIAENIADVILRDCISLGSPI